MWWCTVTGIETSMVVHVCTTVRKSLSTVGSCDEYPQCWTGTEWAQDCVFLCKMQFLTHTNTLNRITRDAKVWTMMVPYPHSLPGSGKTQGHSSQSISLECENQYCKMCWKKEAFYGFTEYKLQVPTKHLFNACGRVSSYHNKCTAPSVSDGSRHRVLYKLNKQ